MLKLVDTSSPTLGNNILDSVESKDNNKYNAFEHLWRSVFPIDANEKLMTILTAYFDESGTDGRSPIVAVGGYISTVELWEDFQREWKRLMGDTVFHATDMLSLRKDFAKENGWDTERVINTFRRADEIIHNYTLFGAVAFTRIKDIE